MAGFAALPRNVRGALWMTLQAASFVASTAAVRYLSDDMTGFQAAFFRAWVGIVILTPWLLRVGWRGLVPSSLRMVTLRNLCAVSGFTSYYIALGMINLTDGAALQFTMPLFAVIGAALILGERVGSRIWLATLVGFFGALIIIRPGFTNLGVPALIVLYSAASFALLNIVTKIVTTGNSSNLIVFHLHLLTIVTMAVPTGIYWAPVEWHHLPWIIAVGAFATLAQLCLTYAMRAADVSVLAPIDFSKLAFAALYSWVLFRETSDMWTWVGATLICSAAIYVTRYELRRARRARRAVEA